MQPGFWGCPGQEARSPGQSSGGVPAGAGDSGRRRALRPAPGGVTAAKPPWRPAQLLRFTHDQPRAPVSRPLPPAKAPGLRPPSLPPPSALVAGASRSPEPPDPCAIEARARRARTRRPRCRSRRHPGSRRPLTEDAAETGHPRALVSCPWRRLSPPSWPLHPSRGQGPPHPRAVWELAPGALTGSDSATGWACGPDSACSPRPGPRTRLFLLAAWPRDCFWPMGRGLLAGWLRKLLTESGPFRTPGGRRPLVGRRLPTRNTALVSFLSKT